MAAIRTEARKATNLAYIEHVGPYDRIPFEKSMERLYAWAKEQGVIPGFYPMGIYHDSPEVTPPEECRSEIAISFKGKGTARGDVRVRRLPAMKVAALSHKGPPENLRRTYAALMAGIEERGYAWAGPAIEVYSRKPERKGGKTILFAKVMAPVKKAGAR